MTADDLRRQLDAANAGMVLAAAAGNWHEHREQQHLAEDARAGLLRLQQPPAYTTTATVIVADSGQGFDKPPPNYQSPPWTPIPPTG